MQKRPAYSDTSFALNLCDALASEHGGTHPKILSVVDSVKAAESAADLASALCRLACEVLHGLPFKLTVQAIQALHRVSRSAPAQCLLAATTLWPGALNHKNREVRSLTMHLLTRLCTVAAADLTPRQLDECVLDIGLPAQLAALLTSAVSSQAIRVPAALALRGLMRAPHIVTSCKKDGQLAVLLQALQAVPRQGLARVVA